MGTEALAPNQRKKTAQAAEICAHFKRTLEGFKLYDRGHVTLDGFLEAVFDRLTSYLQDYDELSLSVSAMTLSVDDTPVLEATGREDSIAYPLALDGVQKLILSRGVTREATDGLMEIWRQSFLDDAASGHSFVTRAWEASFQSIRVVAIETFVEGGEAGQECARTREDNVKAVLSEITTGRLGSLSDSSQAAAKLIQATREDLALLQMDALAELSSEELRRQDSAKRASGLGLDAADSQTLLEELSREAMGDAPASLRSLAFAALQATEAEFEKLSGIVGVVLARMMAAHQYEPLVQVLRRLVGFVRGSTDAAEIERRGRIALRLLELLLSEQTLGPLTASLNDPARAAGAEQLLGFAPRSSLAALLSLIPAIHLESSRRALCDQIVRLAPSSPELTERMRAADPQTAAVLFGLCSRLSPVARRDARSVAIESPHLAIRRLALQDLEREEVSALKPMLVRLLTDADFGIRQAALRHLVPLKDASIVPTLDRFLAHGALEESERKTLLVALGTIGGPEAAFVLKREFAATKSLPLKCTCASALASTGEPSVLPILRETAGKLLANAELKKACREAVERFEALHPPKTKGVRR